MNFLAHVPLVKLVHAVGDRVLYIALCLVVEQAGSSVVHPDHFLVLLYPQVGLGSHNQAPVGLVDDVEAQGGGGSEGSTSSISPGPGLTAT